MVVLVDSDRAVEISIREWDEENTRYGPDWSADFFEVGSLRSTGAHIQGWWTTAGSPAKTKARRPKRPKPTIPRTRPTR